MIISDGHARALVRGLVREHGDRAQATARAVAVALGALPDRRSRLAGFAAGLRDRLSPDALLLQARSDKRRAVLHAVLAQFTESPAGWLMEWLLLDLALRPGRMPGVTLSVLPFRITGHTLERMFQRTRSTDWRSLVAEMEPAVVMMGWLYPPLRSMGFAQAAVQTRGGLLLGEVAPDRAVVFKTFLRADEADQARHAELRSALWGFWIRNGGGRVLTEALFGAGDAHARLEGEASELLAVHPWLACRHFGGEDREGERWNLARAASAREDAGA